MNTNSVNDFILKSFLDELSENNKVYLKVETIVYKVTLSKTQGFNFNPLNNPKETFNCNILDFLRFLSDNGIKVVILNAEAVETFFNEKNY